MPNKFDKFAEKAKNMTDEEFKSTFSSLTSLTDADIDKIINETGISQKDLAELLAVVKNATDFNNQTAQSVMNIQKGVQTLVSVTKKLLL
jgi:succinate dehydrogenase flavin-adding protein (antitoxin of CptAB toxin-antitoxin module)